MNYPETLAWIHGTERFGSRLGLGRMGRLLHRMGDPHLKVPYIHVAGTNGKGSTTTMIASALTAGGLRHTGFRAAGSGLSHGALHLALHLPVQRADADRRRNDPGGSTGGTSHPAAPHR